MTRTTKISDHAKLRLVTRKRSYMGNFAGYTVHCTLFLRLRDGSWHENSKWKRIFNVLTTTEALARAREDYEKNHRRG